MLDQRDVKGEQRSRPARSPGDRALRWSWLLFVLSWPWHLVGGGLAIVITSLAGGDFTAGEGVPRYVYVFLYTWFLTPLVASFVVGAIGAIRWRRFAAIVPALVSLTMAVIVTIFSAEEFWG